MISGIYWERGCRDRNEDSLVFEEIDNDKGKSVLLAVADGIASLDVGHIASGYVIERMTKWFFEYGIKLYGWQWVKLGRTLRRAVYDCHMQMHEFGKSNGIKIGSTCSMVCIRNGIYVCLQLGDSRIIKCSKRGKAKLISEIHRVANGQLSKCLGSIRYDEPKIQFGYLRKGCGILVATDGFVEKLSMNEIGEILCVNSDASCEHLEKRLNGMGKQAAKRGADDNRSAVYVRR